MQLRIAWHQVKEMWSLPVLEGLWPLPFASAYTLGLKNMYNTAIERRLCVY